MKKTIVFILLLAAAPGRADSWGDLFGVDQSDVAGLIAQAQAQRDREAAARQARRSSNLSWGLVVERKHDERCTLAAVAKRHGVTLSPSVPAPEIVYESMAEGWEFASAFTEEHGTKTKIPAFSNAYFPKANKIFITDGRFANLRSSVDQALAGEMTRFLAAKYKDWMDTEQVKTMAASTSEWFGREFEKKPVCGS